jgi:hypothetical protein
MRDRVVRSDRDRFRRAKFPDRGHSGSPAPLSLLPKCLGPARSARTEYAKSMSASNAAFALLNDIPGRKADLGLVGRGEKGGRKSAKCLQPLKAQLPSGGSGHPAPSQRRETRGRSLLTTRKILSRSRPPKAEATGSNLVWASLSSRSSSQHIITLNIVNGHSAELCPIT